MHQEFVKKGLIPKELGKHFNLLFDGRMEGDYSDFARFKADEVVGWQEKTQKFVSQVETLLRELT